LPYRLLKPKDYDKSKHYPLVLFFHGFGERGTDNEKQLKHCVELFAKPEEREKYPCFVAVPQAPGPWLPIGDKDFLKPRPFKGATEALELSVELKNQLAEEFSVDTNRIYISGASNGGYAVWFLLHAMPSVWAAAVPCCGGGDPSTIAVAKHVAIWAFHGDKDTTVPVARTKELIAALEAAGGHPKFTEYKDAHHMDAADRAYKEPELLPWLFEQKRSK